MTAKRTVPIESVIVVVREHRGILSADLARIYGVETRVLNQAVKRNLEKFPGDFIFRLTREEAETLSRSRSQSVILKRGQNIKFLPYVFTFVRLRHIVTTHKELAAKLLELERTVASHDGDIKTLFDAIRQLMEPPPSKSRRIGFKT